jgi:hypothetical protein
MGLIGSAARFTPWARALAIAELALVFKRHIDKLGPGELGELRMLLAKSKGRPSNLTKAEKSRLGTLVRKLEPGGFAKSAATKASPLRRKKP